MKRSQEFKDGFRHASRKAVAFLHMRAEEMNDPHAKLVIDLMADDVGKHLSGKYRSNATDDIISTP